ncbi:hypothetical protein L6452_44028 [Arctium lappa]|uniref:Uncharacterized protein n=1 Tax=Arctium lappa TaxID=4217 RepID=A0ACB8XF37_ARCLA|nr:hypothetical protein L6452_44028 [Arctium lappa]
MRVVVDLGIEIEGTSMIGILRMVAALSPFQPAKSATLSLCVGNRRRLEFLTVAAADWRPSLSVLETADD